MLSHMTALCPLSVKVSFVAFREASHLDFKQSLNMDYTLETKLMIAQNYNFQAGVKNYLSKKKVLPWKPETLEEIDELQVRNLFKVEDYKLKLDSLEI